MTSLKERIQADVSKVFLAGAESGFADEGQFTFSPSTGEKTVDVIFDEYFEPTDQFSHEITGAGPGAIGSAADLLDDEGNLPQSDAILVIEKVTYYVTKAQKFGDLVYLALSKDPTGGAVDA